MNKRIAITLVSLVLLLIGLSSAQADGIVPYYDYAAAVNVGFLITDGSASCSGSVQPKERTHKATVTVKLQQNNGGWTTIATWSGSALAGKTASASGTKSLDSGYDYRVVVSGTIKNASGTVLERPSATSAIKSY